MKYAIMANFKVIVCSWDKAIMQAVYDSLDNNPVYEDVILSPIMFINEVILTKEVV